MSKAAFAVNTLPATALKSLKTLGADMALARKRRKESLRSWSLRMNISVPTLMRMEAGDPAVGIGVYATGLWLIGRSNALGELANPQDDLGALQRDIDQAKGRHAKQTVNG